MNTKPAVIFGAGGHAVSLLETVTAAGFDVVAFTSEDAAPNARLFDRPVLSAIPEGHVDSGGIVVIGVGDNSTRERVWKSIVETVPVYRLPTVIHPSASVSAFATIDAGTVVMQGAVVGSGAHLGVGCIVNSAAVVEHECELGDFASLAPRATLGGSVRIGARSAVSIGAVVKHGLSIGPDTVIGAGAYVHHDVPAGVVSYGVPAQIVRQRHPVEPYLG